MEHDVMGCRDCWVHGDIVYCEKSKFHPNHPHHHCPPWQNCYCLAPEYSSDLSAPQPSLYCQEIGLVAPMFFFELLLSYVSSSISFYVSFANLFSIILFPYLLITRDTQDEGEARFNFTDTGKSLKVILRLKDLSRSPNRLVAPLVDLYQSLHSNSASTTSMSPSISTTGASSILSTPTAPKRASPSSSERPIVRWITNPETKL